MTSLYFQILEITSTENGDEKKIAKRDKNRTLKRYQGK